MNEFWIEHPALLYGLGALLGCAIYFNLLFLFPASLLLLFFFYPNLRFRLALAALVAILCYLSLSFAHQFPPSTFKEAQGTALIEITSLSKGKSHFGAQWIYRGRILWFKENGNVIARNIPFSYSLSAKEDWQRPPADAMYIVKGRLKRSSNGNFSLAIKNSTPWLIYKNGNSTAEQRYLWKSGLINFIKDHISDPNSATFLAGIMTGDFDDRLMTQQFGRFGVQHIMAISGFHFALIAGLLLSVLRLVFPYRTTVILVLVLVTAYFFFLGWSPSVVRAWITIMVGLAAALVERPSIGLNSLGFSLLFVAVLDPLLFRTAGFQFSALVTACILLLHPLIDLGLQQVFLKRPLSHLAEMDTTNQHGYVVLSWLRQMVSLGLAVNAAALPLTLYYFHKFPIMSLFYNLFFPFLVSITMTLLLLSLALAFVPLLGSALFALTTSFTAFMLRYIYDAPTVLDVMWRVPELPSEWLIVGLTVLFAGTMILRTLVKQQRAELREYVWI